MAIAVSVIVGLAIGLAIYTSLVSCMLFLERLKQQLDTLDKNLIWLDRLIIRWPARRGGL